MSSDIIQVLVSKLNSEICNSEQSAKIINVSQAIARCAHCNEEYAETFANLSKENPSCFLKALSKIDKHIPLMKSYLGSTWHGNEKSSCERLINFDQLKKYELVTNKFCRN